MRSKYNGGEWTQARFNSFVKGGLRGISKRWPPKYQCLNAAKQGKRINVNTGRLAEHYLCAVCNQSFPAKDVQVDHKEPVVPVSGFTSWDEVIDRMFCEADNLQVLCTSCHKVKTSEERLLAKQHKETNGSV